MAAIKIAIPLRTLEPIHQRGISIARQQTVYKLVPPYEYADGSESVDPDAHPVNCQVKTIEFVLVSAVTLTMPPAYRGLFRTQDETYIFPSNEDGSEWDGGELPGSAKNTLSHQEVLANMGYTIQPTSVGLIEDLSKEES